jgi:hypothetical protein
VSEVARVRDRLGLVTLAYAHRALFALVAAIGPATIVTRASANFGGDAALFEAGGALLFEGQRLGQRTQPAVFTTWLVILILGVLSGALVLGAVIDGFSRRSKLDAGDLADGATRAIGTVALLLLAGGAAEALAAAVVIGALVKAIDAMHLGFGADLAANGAMLVLTAVVVGGVAVVRDLACASAVLDRKRFGGAVAAAWRALGPGVLGACAWRSLASVGIAAAGWFGGPYVPVIGHQLAAFGIALVHVSWIKVAVETTLSIGGEPPVRHGLPSSEPLGYVPPPSPPAAVGGADGSVGPR